MDIALLALKLLILLLVCCTGPGLLLAGRLRFSPMEKLCAAVAVSFICIYLASFGLFCLNAEPWAYWAASLLFGIMGLAGWKTARLLICHRSSRRTIAAFCVVLAWEALHLAMVRNYSGGDWQGDWREHFERTAYFCHQLPKGFEFLGVYQLPARPPMMNVIAAFFCRQLGLRFEVYSLVFLFCNASAFLPCALLLRRLAPRGGRYVAVLTLLFMLNPSMVQNATLTVTKAMTAGLVVLGVCFYLRQRVVAAAISLAAAVLAHYSAVPYAAAIGLHYLCGVLLGRRPWRETISAVGGATALMATWLGWSIAIYGMNATFFSNTTATGKTHKSVAQNIGVAIYDMYTTIVPHPLHPVHLKPFVPIKNAGDLRDYYFTMSQTTLPMMIGIAGGVVAAMLLARKLIWAARPPPNRGFWTFFLIFTFIVGVAVNAEWHDYGLANVTLQPLALMGVTLVAAWLPSLGPAAVWLVLLGSAIDYALGILLEFDRESRVYPTFTGPSGQWYIGPDPTLGGTGAQEYIAKLQHGLVFWGDHFATAGPALEVASAAIAACAIWMLGRVCLAHTINTPARTAPPRPSPSP